MRREFATVGSTAWNGPRQRFADAGGMKVAISLKPASDLDYVRELMDHWKIRGAVSEVMTSQVVTPTPNTLLARATRVMVERHLKRLPVVNTARKVVWIRDAWTC